MCVCCLIVGNERIICGHGIFLYVISNWILTVRGFFNLEFVRLVVMIALKLFSIKYKKHRTSVLGYWSASIHKYYNMRDYLNMGFLCLRYMCTGQHRCVYPVIPNLWFSNAPWEFRKLFEIQVLHSVLILISLLVIKVGITSSLRNSCSAPDLIEIRWKIPQKFSQNIQGCKSHFKQQQINKENIVRPAIQTIQRKTI